jgi:DoxX-like family
MAKTILYWVTTSLIVFAYAVGGYFDITQPEFMAKDLEKTGYPSYFLAMLGIWKLGAVVTLLMPGLPRLKEWAYAGITINLIGASVAHYYMNDPVPNIAIPLIILLIALISWFTRPDSRRLAGPLL